MDFMGLLIPLFIAVAVLLVLAKLIVSEADEDRQASETEGGQVEFAPNRRSFWGVYVFLGCLAYVLIASFVGGIKSSADLAAPAFCAGFAILLLSAFPGSIRVDKNGIEQVYWLRSRKRIAWNEIATVTTDEKRGEVRIKGKNGAKILFARQLPDRARLLLELEKHSDEKAPAQAESKMYAMSSGPAA
ncbi:MAG: PH domain-containing protein [Terracidiphilus sp.]